MDTWISEYLKAKCRVSKKQYKRKRTTMHTNGRPNTTQNTKIQARRTPILIGRELVSFLIITRGQRDNWNTVGNKFIQIYPQNRFQLI